MTVLHLWNFFGCRSFEFSVKTKRSTIEFQERLGDFNQKLLKKFQTVIKYCIFIYLGGCSIRLETKYLLLLILLVLYLLRNSIVYVCFMEYCGCLVYTSSFIYIGLAPLFNFKKDYYNGTSYSYYQWNDYQKKRWLRGK